MGSDELWISIWDLQLLEDGYLGAMKLKEPKKPNPKTSRLVQAPKESKEEHGCAQGKFPGPFDPLLPHKTIRIPNIGFAGPPYTTRHFSFSVGGEWCVMVGDDGMICLFRWPHNVALLDD